MTITADREQCSLHLFAGPWSEITLCDQVRGMLANYGLAFAFEHSPGAADRYPIHWQSLRGNRRRRDEAKIRARVEKALFAAGYPGISWKYADGEP